MGTASTAAVRVSAPLLAPGASHRDWKRSGCGHQPRDVIAEGKGPRGSTDSPRLQIFKTASRGEGERRGEQT